MIHKIYISHRNFLSSNHCCSLSGFFGFSFPFFHRSGESSLPSPCALSLSIWMSHCWVLKLSIPKFIGVIRSEFGQIPLFHSNQIHQHVLFAHLKVDTHLRNPFCGLMAYPLAFLGSVPSLTLCLNDTKSCVPFLGLIIFGNK